MQLGRSTETDPKSTTPSLQSRVFTYFQTRRIIVSHSTSYLITLIGRRGSPRLYHYYLPHADYVRRRVGQLR